MTEINTNFFRRSKPQVLVIEDSPDHWYMVRWALLEQFPEVEPVWVANTEEANTYLETTKKLPKLILLDLYVPTRQAGWALLEAIKAHDLYKNIPVIMLSHSDHPGDIVKSYQLRSNSYVVKPGSYDEWLSCFAQFRHYWWQAVTLPNTRLD